MDLLNQTFYGNTLTDWLTALGVAVAVWIVLAFVRGWVTQRFQKLAEKTSTRIDDGIADLVSRTRGFFLLLVGLYAGSRFVTLGGSALQATRIVLVLGITLQAALWAQRAVQLSIEELIRKRDSDPSTATTLRGVSLLLRVAIWSVALLLALDNLGFEVTTLVASLGIGGIAVALAVQNILGDLFSSLSIVLDKPFVIGDFVVVGDMMGTIEHIGLKTTRVRSLSGEQLVFGNSDLLSSRLRNFKRMQERRILFSFGVVYATPQDKLEQIPRIVREIVESQPEVRFDRAHFKQFGASSLDFEVVYYVLRPDYNVFMDVQQAINLALFERFTQLGIEFAFPTQTVHVESMPGSTPRP
ncbi:MAG: mechanosensitive ion channel family protein [Acidobacteriota bacterium]|nr:MAG: mechanosensitive ion channel family protein [Acidobacteriota bacterium]